MYTNSEAKWSRIIEDIYLDNENPTRILTVVDPPKGYVIWNFIVNSRNIILKFSSWEINDGHGVKLWVGSWNGKPPLVENQELQEVRAILSEAWGVNLLMYVQSSNSLTQKVVWKKPPSSLISTQQSDLFCNVMKERIVYLSTKLEKIIWAASKFGTYSVKEGYALLSQSKHPFQPLRAFTFCWNNKVLTKVGSFMWLAIQKNPYK